MRIAIPVKNLDSGRNLIAKSLDANGHLCLFDQKTEELKWLKISELAPNLAELFPALKKASVTEIVSGSLHPMALKVLVNRGFEVYRSQGSNLQYNLSLRKAERLLPFNMAELMAETSGCGSSCSSCENSCENVAK